MKKSNIVLRNTAVLLLILAIVPSIVSAALTRELQLGSRGADVSELQTFLAADTSVYPQGLITGYFGSLTAAAVRRFQAKNGISQVGRVGPQTMAAINAQMGGGGFSGAASPGFTTTSQVSTSGNVVTVTVNTNVPTRATLYYSPSPLSLYENELANPTVTVGGTAVNTNTSLQTSHTIATLPLVANTTYYYTVVVSDVNGRVSMTYPRAVFQTGSF
ncbi:MAG: peptidoglycan-binding domain-containing protein [Patescibacteria group bacterium]